MLKPFQPKRAVLALAISLLLNGYFLYSKVEVHEEFKQNGEVVPLYVKSLDAKHTSTFERIKFTKVAQVHFFTKDRVKISGRIKDTWGMHIEGLETVSNPLPLTKVIYHTKNPSQYMLLDEFNSFSLAYSIFSYGVFGLLFIGFWIYALSGVLLKGVKRIK